MPTFRVLFRFLSISVIFAQAGLVAHAEDLQSVKASITARMPRLNALKASGSIGENNRGMVEALHTEAASVVADENRDRVLVYAAVAKENKWTPAEAVGKLRAKQIALESPSGFWLQRADGSWYKK